MRIVVISGSLYPSSEKFYGSEHISSLLAGELGKLGNDVVLLLPHNLRRENIGLYVCPVPTE